MGILTHATSEYMKDQFPDVDQPDMITANFEFLGVYLLPQSVDKNSY